MLRSLWSLPTYSNWIDLPCWVYYMNEKRMYVVLGGQVLRESERLVTCGPSFALSHQTDKAERKRMSGVLSPIILGEALLLIMFFFPRSQTCLVLMEPTVLLLAHFQFLMSSGPCTLFWTNFYNFDLSLELFFPILPRSLNLAFVNSPPPPFFGMAISRKSIQFFYF